MEIEGRIAVVVPARSGISQKSGAQWMSQEYVIEYYWYPNQSIPSRAVMKVFGEDKIKAWGFEVGDEVLVRYHIEAREYNEAWYNDVRLDGVTFVGKSVGKGRVQTTAPAEPLAQSPTPPANEAPLTPPPTAEGNGDDLPF